MAAAAFAIWAATGQWPTQPLSDDCDNEVLFYFMEAAGRAVFRRLVDGMRRFEELSHSDTPTGKQLALQRERRRAAHRGRAEGGGGKRVDLLLMNEPPWRSHFGELLLLFFDVYERMMLSSGLDRRTYTPQLVMRCFMRRCIMRR